MAVPNAGNQGMEQLIPIVNKLQDAFTSLGVHMALGMIYNFTFFEEIIIDWVT